MPTLPMTSNLCESSLESRGFKFGAKHLDCFTKERVNCSNALTFSKAMETMALNQAERTDYFSDVFEPREVLHFTRIRR